MARITPEPTIKQLKNRLSQLLGSRTGFAGSVYRSCTPKYANEADLLNGNGGKTFAGRWNPIGIAVVYGSLTPETAMAETLAHNRYFGIAVEDAMPRTFVAIEAKLQLVVDFRLGVVRQRIQVSQERILAVDWRKEVRAGREPITQKIGRAACEIGLEGIVVPSAVDLNGYNLVVFPKNLRAGSEIRVLNPGRLSK